MRSTASLFAFACALSEALAVYQGFNYGSTQTDGTVKTQQVFEDEFNAAKKLVGTNGGFTSARLYTMIQGGTTSDVISAIPAAIATNTSLLLGLWASGGAAAFAYEITALKAAAEQYGSELEGLIAGISVGSEDLYRDTYTYISSTTDPDEGASPDTITSYIKQVRTAIEGTSFSSAKIGHVDTWNAWTNSTVTTVIDNVDWLGVDEYPFFQNTMANSIDNAKTLFYNAYDAVEAIAGGKDVWITETGWPVSGSTENEGVASLANAKTFWDEIGCPSFGSVNTWWYTLQDAYPTTPNPSFGVVGSTLSTTPLYDLSCSNVTTSSTSSKSTNTASIISSARSAASSAGGLTPTQSAGNGIGAGSSGSVTASATYVSGAAASIGLATGASGSNGTSVATTRTPTSTSSVVATGAASAVTGSIVGGVFGVFVALMAAL